MSSAGQGEKMGFGNAAGGAGRVFCPNSPGTKIKVLLEFWEAKKNQEILIYCAQRGKNWGAAPGDPNSSFSTKSKEKKGNCGSGIAGGGTNSNPSPAPPRKSLSHPKKIPINAAVPVWAKSPKKNPPISVSREALWVQKSLSTQIYQKFFNQTLKRIFF